MLTLITFLLIKYVGTMYVHKFIIVQVQIDILFLTKYIMCFNV